MSENHLNKIKAVLNKIQSNDFDLIKEYFKITSSNNSAVDKYEELLYEAIISGFQESVYVKLVQERN